MARKKIKVRATPKKARRTAGALTAKKAAKPEFMLSRVLPCCGKGPGADVCRRVCGGPVDGVYLGKFHKFAASLIRERGRVVLAAGCQRFKSPNAARKHWSRRADRPRHPEMIALAGRAAKAVGWKWGR